MEHPVLGGPVPLGGQQAPPPGSRHAAAQQEDIGFLAGLQYPELGVDCGQLGDQPVRVWSRPALTGGGLIPGGPAVSFRRAVRGVKGV